MQECSSRSDERFGDVTGGVLASLNASLLAAELENPAGYPSKRGLGACCKSTRTPRIIYARLFDVSQSPRERKGERKRVKAASHQQACPHEWASARKEKGENNGLRAGPYAVLMLFLCSALG